MNLVEQIINEVVTPFLEPRIKKTSLKAVKGYVTSVQVARKIAIASYSVSAVAAIAVAGIILMIVAIIGLFPIEPRTAFISMLIVGALLTLASVAVTLMGFNQKTWLEKSKANDLMEAAIKPWATAYSVPDPRRIFAAQTDQPIQRERDVEAPIVHDSIAQHTPQATYASMMTPDAAMTTRSIDTTSPLHR